MSQPGTPPEHASNDPSLRLTEHGPVPAATRPDPTRLNEPPAEAYDDLADLFLGPTGPTGPTAPVKARHHSNHPDVSVEALVDAFIDESTPDETALDEPGMTAPAHGGPMIEGLVLGHLPVIASAWVAQYARDLAHREGKPVAMLRRYGPRVSLDLIGVRLDSPCDRLEDALALAAARVDRWLIRVDDTDEPSLAECGRLDALTLLTGADEAATVASYRTLKSLSGIFEGEGPDLTLAIMGAPAERARHAAEKLQKAARTFLNRDVRTACTARRIAAAMSCTLYRGESPLDLIGLLDRLERAGTEALPSEHQPAPADTSPRPTPVATAPPLATRMDQHEPVAHAVRVDDSACKHSGHPSSTEYGPDPALESALPEHTIGLLANVEPIAARCPHAPDVELGVGPTGRLHVVARATRDEHEQSLRRVLAAAGWARLNASLLAMTDPRLTEPSLAEHDEPVLHMITDDARTTRPLLDSDVRLHVCQRVTVGTAHAWACSPLN